MNKEALNHRAKLINAIFWILFILFNPLSVFIEIFLIAKTDPAFMWHLYVFVKDHRITVAVILFYAFILLAIYKLKELLE